MHMGPVTLNTSLQKFSEYPRTGDFIAGITKPSAKGDVFVWWVHRAKPVMELIRNRVKAGSFCTRASAVGSNPFEIRPFCRSLPVHAVDFGRHRTDRQADARRSKAATPSGKGCKWYQRKEILIKRDPVAFAFFTAMFCPGEKMLESVFEAAEKEGVMDFGRYTMKRLKTMLDNAKPFD